MTSRTFTAPVEPAGDATGVTVPQDTVDDLDGGRPLVVISINGHSWRSHIATKNGRSHLANPGNIRRSRFRRRHSFVSMRQQWFTHVRLLIAHLTRSRRAFSTVASHPDS
jgi:hypothetical protein